VEPSNQLDPEPGDPEPGDPELLEVDPLLVARWLAEESPLRIIDVREAVELVSGILPGAIHIPLGDLAMMGSMGLVSRPSTRMKGPRSHPMRCRSALVPAQRASRARVAACHR
jgi:hypothetical protein